MTRQSRLVGGVYEIGVGVSDLERAAARWHALGYTSGVRGRLEAADAARLYNVESGLTSLRLTHQAATNGLVRLMQWDQPVGAGLNMAPLRVHGCRWSVHRTDNISLAEVHGQALKAQGQPLHLHGPVYNFNLTKPLAEKRPLEEPIEASGDILLFLPEAQIVVMTRISFDVPLYGTINPNAPLRTSEACHVGLVVQGTSLAPFFFYSDVLGFKRGKHVSVPFKPGSMASDLFGLQHGERFTEVDFDDPKSGDTPATHLPGRLRCFLLETDYPADDRQASAQPGHLGHSLYTVRHTDLDLLHHDIVSSVGASAGPIIADEFGTQAFGFTAPDGFRWLALNAT